MIIKLKKYVATVDMFKEHEDGTITKERKEITLEGKRFSPATVWKNIPREAHLVDSGWVDKSFEIDDVLLEKFLMENGKPVGGEK